MGHRMEIQKESRFLYIHSHLFNYIPTRMSDSIYL